VAAIAIEDGQPIVAGTGLPVAQVVRACHDKTVDVALAELTAPGLARETLEPVLTYCAEQRCRADNATCRGCRMHLASQGVLTFDDFVDRHAEIRFRTSPVVLRGRGAEVLTAESLERLAKTWAGEEYWFWARRVLRKMRHGIRRARQSGAPPEGAGAPPTFILVRPQLADNIGMVARALANFGLEELRLVAPRDGWPNEKARIAASGANFIIDGAEAYPTFEGALAGLNWVAATSARQRDLAKPVLTPEQVVAEMLRRTSEGQRCGIVFGPERNGLETEEAANADALVMAPVNPNFASLNLAQAVLLVGYEWYKVEAASIGQATPELPAIIAPGLRAPDTRAATKDELDGFFHHLEEELDRAGFYKTPEKKPGMVRNMRNLFLRAELTEQEVRSLRGMVASLSRGHLRPKRES
jgi:tRNA/rRNA methyltransferase